jgi:hypothetical protein
VQADAPQVELVGFTDVVAVDDVTTVDDAWTRQDNTTSTAGWAANSSSAEGIPALVCARSMSWSVR